MTQKQDNPTWRELFLVYSKPRVIAVFFLGFAGGLPFLLVFSTLTAWLRDDGVSRSAIGFFAWVGITYSVKVFWSPVVDRFAVPILTRYLGQRRSWILVGQIGIALGLLGMTLAGSSDLFSLSIFALIVAFSSATQDIAIDAYRIEALPERYQGAMSASYVFGYRVALLAAGAGALFLADFGGWTFAYQVMALLCGIGITTVFLIDEPEKNALQEPASQSLSIPLYMKIKNALADPFIDFFERNGSFALVILLFIAVFRLSDIAMGIMANPFYLDMGYTKSEIATVAKIFGFFMIILGSFVCGLLVVKWDIMKCLLIGAIAVATTNLLFAALSLVEPSLQLLAVVISADNISGGFAATAFMAYLSSLTNRAYTATQYALFSSLMTLPGKLISGFSGVLVDGYGYTMFFTIAAGLGIPAIVLVLVLMRHRNLSASNTASRTV